MKRFEWVPDDRIEPGDTTFRVRTRYPTALAESIEACGIRTPMLLARLDRDERGGFRIVSGWGRFECRPPGVALPAFILDPAVDEEQLWTRFLRDNDRWNVVEAATVLDRLRSLPALDEERIVSEKLPLLGLRPAREVMRRHLRLLELPASVRDFIEEEDLPLSRTEPFVRLGAKAADRLAVLARSLRLTLNEIAETSQWVDEVSRRDAMDAEPLLVELQKSASERKAEFRRLLEERRFPELTEFRRRLDALRGELRFRLPASVEWDARLERPGFRLAFEVREATDLEALRRDFEENRETLERFFEIL